SPPPGVVYITDTISALSGKLGRMRNKACEAASSDIIVVTDDDVLFDRSFYTQLCQCDLDFDVACTRLLNPDGSRYWDWAIANANEHRLIPDDQHHEDIYVTGGRCLINRRALAKARWNESLG